MLECTSFCYELSVNCSVWCQTDPWRKRRQERPSMPPQKLSCRLHEEASRFFSTRVCGGFSSWSDAFVAKFEYTHRAPGGRCINAATATALVLVKVSWLSERKFVQRPTMNGLESHKRCT
jgi:hypothetical protein